MSVDAMNSCRDPPKAPASCSRGHRGKPSIQPASSLPPAGLVLQCRAEDPRAFQPTLAMSGEHRYPLGPGCREERSPVSWSHAQPQVAHEMQTRPLEKPVNRPSSIDAEIDSLTSMLADMENNSPFHPRPRQVSYGPGGTPTQASRPEDELDRITKKLVHDMNNPPTEEYFGRCARCGENVVGDGTGCIAMDQVFHVECFTCMTCRSRLRGQPFYAIDKKSYCESCYINTLEQCSVCSKPIMDRILRAMGRAYHPQCFTCVVCHRCLDGIPFTVDATSQIHCIEDFHMKFAPRCSVCAKPIMPEAGQEETVRIVALDRSFHVNCYKCEDCGFVLSSEGEGCGCYPLDGHILCKNCSARRIQDLSAKITTDC
uniref:thyroid receptor-interacting protein 6 isoform X5 n=1 Tax=Pristiophorus japonicus TaxID=55135 RepID=UPI00398E9FD6